MLNTTYLGCKIKIKRTKYELSKLRQIKLFKPLLSQVIFLFCAYLCLVSLFEQ